MLKARLTCVLLVLTISFLDDAFCDDDPTPVPRLPLETASDNDVVHLRTNLTLNKLIGKHFRNSMRIVDQLMVNKTEFMKTISDGKCNKHQMRQARFLSTALQKMTELLFLAYNKTMSAIELNDINNAMAKTSNMLENSHLTWRFRDIKTLGLTKAKLTKFNFNLCTLKGEFVVVIPKLEVTAKYRLKGDMNGTPISGDGKIKALIKELKVHDSSYPSCQMDSSKNDSCGSSLKDAEGRPKMKNITLEITGIKYKDMTEPQINTAINDYVQFVLHADTNATAPKTSGLVQKLKEALNSLGPVQLLHQLQNSIHMIKDPSSRPENYRSVLNRYDLCSANPPPIMNNNQSPITPMKCLDPFYKIHL